ncbi:MAG: mechanosensitive ion channel family protein [Parvularcula sp.]
MTDTAPAPTEAKAAIDIASLKDQALDLVYQIRDAAMAWLASPGFYTQTGIIVGAIVAAWALNRFLKGRLKAPASIPLPAGLGDAAPIISRLFGLMLPFLIVVALSAAKEISHSVTGQSAIAQLLLGIAVVLLLRVFVRAFISNPMIRFLTNWVAVPAALLQVFGLLDDLIGTLQSVKLSIGNIDLSAYALLRTAIFGSILFWLGRISNDTGKRVIREQEALDVRTREIVTKLFEILLFIVVFMILLQVMGVGLTSLAVFGGAIGVGLGFGLQQIAANFISGIIILLDKSLTIGDFIELEDGRSGTIRELGLRCATVETFDGKDIVVPNDQFITTAFTNWTHFDNKQRYDLTFAVSYDTDLPALFDLVREVVASHSQVLSGPDYTEAEQPDAEIDAFGDSGITVLVEFWMEGVDDGKNRVDADLKLMIWKALKENGFSMPFPQREVRILGDSRV